NLSSIDIPLEVKYLLQLGEKFGLPINKNNKEKTLIEFIKQIENNVIGRPKNIINFVRNNSISILNRFQNNFPSPNFFDKQISNWLHIINKFINITPLMLGNVQRNFRRRLLLCLENNGAHFEHLLHAERADNNAILP
ncbi:hypothetical protein ALC57_05372, partial [Trachymyrmex cornetzi]